MSKEQQPIDTSKIKTVSINIAELTIRNQLAKLIKAARTYEYIRLEVSLSEQPAEKLIEFLNVVKNSKYGRDLKNKVTELSVTGKGFSFSTESNEKRYTLAPGIMKELYKNGYDRTGAKAKALEKIKQAKIKIRLKERQEEIKTLRNNVKKLEEREKKLAHFLFEIKKETFDTVHGILLTKSLLEDDRVPHSIKPKQKVYKWIEELKKSLKEIGGSAELSQEEEGKLFFLVSEGTKAYTALTEYKKRTDEAKKEVKKFRDNSKQYKIDIKEYTKADIDELDEYVEQPSFILTLNQKTIKDLHNNLPNIVRFEMENCYFEKGSISELKAFKRLQSLEIVDSIEWVLKDNKTAIPSYTLTNLNQLQNLRHLTHKFSYHDNKLLLGHQREEQVLGRFNKEDSIVFFETELSQLRELTSLTASNIWDLEIPLPYYKKLTKLTDLNLTGQDYRFLKREEPENKTVKNTKKEGVYFKDFLDPVYKKIGCSLENIERLNVNTLLASEEDADYSKALTKANLMHFTDAFPKNRHIKFEGLHFANNFLRTLKKLDSLKTLYFSSTMNEPNSLILNKNSHNNNAPSTQKKQSSKKNSNTLCSIISQFHGTIEDLTIVEPTIIRKDPRKTDSGKKVNLSPSGTTHYTDHTVKQENNRALNFESIVEELKEKAGKHKASNHKDDTKNNTLGHNEKCYLTQLKNVRIASENINDGFIEFVLNNAPMLETLIIKPHVKGQGSNSREILLRAPQISAFLHNTPNDSGYSKKLRHFSLSLYGRAKDEDRKFDIKCLQKYTDLETIELDQCEINFDDLEATISKLPNLTKLRIYMSQVNEEKCFITPEVLKRIKLKNPCLEFLLGPVTVIRQHTDSITADDVITLLDTITSLIHFFEEMEADTTLKSNILANQIKRPELDVKIFGITSLNIDTLTLKLENKDKNKSQKEQLEEAKNELKRKCNETISFLGEIGAISKPIQQELTRASNLIDKLRLQEEATKAPRIQSAGNNNNNIDDNDKEERKEDREIDKTELNNDNQKTSDSNAYLGLLLNSVRNIMKPEYKVISRENWELLNINNEDIALYKQSLSKISNNKNEQLDTDISITDITAINENKATSK